MKKLIILTVLVLIISSSFSQDFVKEGKQWNISEEMNFGPTVTLIYRIEGDTVANDLNYKKVWYYQDSTFSVGVLFGLIRDDGGKVFFWSGNSNGESLLYDFDIGVGDTVRVLSLPQQGNCEVELVCIGMDTVSYFGIPRKRWSFASYDSEIWIEGIGNTYGLFQNRYYECLNDVYYDLLCSYEGDSLIYQNPWGDPCYINTVGVEEVVDKSGIKIIPNPVHQDQSFQLISSVSIKTVGVYGVNGTMIRQTGNLKNTDLTVETKGLRKGIYLLKIRLADNSEVIKKLIIY